MDYDDGFRDGYAAGVQAGMNMANSMPTVNMDAPSSISNRDRAGSRFMKKRKPSAYQVWAKKERPKIVKQHPRFSFGRINQELGKRWKRSKDNPKNKGGRKR